MPSFDQQGCQSLECRFSGLKMLHLILVVYLAQGALGLIPLDGEFGDSPSSRMHIHPLLNASKEGMEGKERAAPTNFDITYHGGPVMHTPNAYIIWYGQWTEKAKHIVEHFVKGVGETAWWGINKSYGVNKLHYKGSCLDEHYSQGKTMTQFEVRIIVARAIYKKLLPKDPDGIYLVLSSSDVAVNGFCSVYCGYHDHFLASGIQYKIAFIGIPPPSCTGCIIQPISPNGDAAVDSLVKVVAHELAEAATDPLQNGWCYTTTNYCDGASTENADQCNTYYPNVILYENYYYNLVVGKRKYLIQANWNLDTRSCSMN